MKKIKAFLKSRELIFIITVYPALFFLIMGIKKIGMEWTNSNPIYYGLTILVLSIFMIFYVLLEVITKVFNYELQGDKLKIRQQEGINIEEMNNGR